MAHFAGLVAAGAHPDPLPHADVVTATTYKNLRGVRGGLILSAREDLERRLNSAVFPGVQGSVILNAVAAKAVALGEALQPAFREYALSVLENARALAAALLEQGIDVLTGGTDTPLLLIDLRSLGITGAAASDALETAGLTANKNGVPGDPEPPTVTSGLRLGTRVGRLVAEILKGLAAGDLASISDRTRAEVADLCRRFPIY
jgi:glycine hydroxymethyltransferase